MTVMMCSPGAAAPVYAALGAARSAQRSLSAAVADRWAGPASRAYETERAGDAAELGLLVEELEDAVSAYRAHCRASAAIAAAMAGASAGVARTPLRPWGAASPAFAPARGSGYPAVGLRGVG